MEEKNILDPDHAPGQLRISVIIPTYNRAPLLVAAVDSVLAQRDLPPGVALEVIVVDDGSTDDTPLRMAAYAPDGRAFTARDQAPAPPVVYLRLANGGVARARNAGVRASQGELLCFLDSDDLWLPDKLARQLAQAARNSEAALFATEILPFDGDRGDRIDRTRSKAALYRIEDGWAVERLLFGNWIQTSTVMVRRAAFTAAGGFDEDVGQFGEDWLLWMRVASAHPVRFLAEPLVRYRLHPESLTSHQPESQFHSLMTILDRLALLPQFVRKPWLIARARYRVCVGRAQRDLAAGDPARAIVKLRRARSTSRWPARALALFALASVRVWLSQRRAVTEAGTEAGAEVER